MNKPNWLQRTSTTWLRLSLAPVCILEAVLLQATNQHIRFTAGYIIAMTLLRCIGYILSLALIAGIVWLFRRRGFYSLLSWLILIAALFEVAVQVLAQMLLDL